MSCNKGKAECIMIWPLDSHKYHAGTWESVCRYIVGKRDKKHICMWIRSERYSEKYNGLVRKLEL